MELEKAFISPGVLKDIKYYIEALACVYCGNSDIV